MRGFFERHARLLETGHGGADDVGQTPHRVGDDEQQRRVLRGIEKGKRAAVLGHRDIAKGEHKSRHRERQHGQRIKQPSAREVGADGDVGDGDAEQEVHDRGDARVFQAVDDRRHGEVVAERGVVVMERPGVRQHGLIPIARE